MASHPAVSGDDAPQWTWLTEDLALCWVHGGHHYKKLTPWVGAHRAAVDNFLAEFWDFYGQVLAYREQPSEAERVRLAAASEILFTTTTDYWALNDRIAKTRAKKRRCWWRTRIPRSLCTTT
jgi:hypothetical protein